MIKVGGALLESDQIQETTAGIAQVLMLAQQNGVRCVLVHGGGSRVNAALRAAGHEPMQRDGIRISPESQMDLIAGVLAGSTNSRFCAHLRSYQIAAVGLTLSDGIPGGSARLTGYAPERGFGRVADASRGSPDLLNTLLDSGFVPVLSSIATGPTEDAPDDPGLWNVNADTAAVAVAATIGASSIALVSDVAGVRDQTGSILAELDDQQAEAMIRDGTIHGGMIAKVRAAMACVETTGIPSTIVDRLGLAGAVGVITPNRHTDPPSHTVPPGNATVAKPAGTRLRRRQ